MWKLPPRYAGCALTWAMLTSDKTLLCLVRQQFPIVGPKTLRILNIVSKFSKIHFSPNSVFNTSGSHGTNKRPGCKSEVGCGQVCLVIFVVSRLHFHFAWEFSYFRFGRGPALLFSSSTSSMCIFRANSRTFHW